MTNRKTLLRILPFLLVVCYFLYFAANGLSTWFTGDDLMNLQVMHGCFTIPLYRIALAVFNPFSSYYRPLGGLFYRLIYAVAGFHPEPFRDACFALLLANLWVAYRLLRRISGSTEAALLGVLLFAYHAQLYELYLSTGTIYDILCFTFFTLALDVYLRFRRPGGGLAAPAWAALLLLDLLALQSKEMAWTLPLVLLLVIAVKPPRPFRPASLGPCLATGLLTLAPVFPRILGPTGLSASPFYQPNLTLGYLLSNYAHYWGFVFYAPRAVPVAVMLASWLVMGLLAWFLRSRPMCFGLLFWMITLVPVGFIRPRGGYVLYLPLLGIALYFGVLAARLRDSIPAPRTVLWRRTSQALLFLVLAAGLAAAHARHRSMSAGFLAAQEQTRNLAAQLLQLHPTLPHHSHTLFVEDPFQAEWFLAYLFRLLYHDPTLWVDSASTHPHVRPYDFVFRYSDGTLEELPPRNAPCTPHAAPAGLTDDSSSLLCWTGEWTSQRFPQAAQETLTYASEAGAAVTFAFHGTAFEYLCTRAFNRGMASIEIDGKPRGTLDLYSPSTEWQSAFPFGGLAPGDHVAVVRVLGKHNPASRDSIVDVDAFRAR